MFFYTDANDYPRTQAGLLARCYDEVVAEAKDTGDFPMYGEALLRQSAEWKAEEFLQEQEQYEENCAASAIADFYNC